MTLGIIILNWNQAGDTLTCLRNAQQWDMPGKRIWIVDNGSRPEDVRALAEVSGDGVQVIFSAVNRGFAGGNNLALQQALDAGCGAVLLLNNDAQAGADAIGQLWRTLNDRAEIGIVGPVLVDAADPRRVLSAGGKDIARHLASHRSDVPPPGQVRLVDYVPGTCVMIRADVLRAVGLLDEDYFFGGEMADLCARARQKGWHSAVDGSAVVRHAVDRSALIRHRVHIYYVIRNRFLYVRNFYPQSRWGLFTAWTAYSLYAAALAVLRGDLAHARAIGLGCLDGWRGRFGGQNARVTRGEVS